MKPNYQTGKLTLAHDRLEVIPDVAAYVNGKQRPKKVYHTELIPALVKHRDKYTNRNGVTLNRDYVNPDSQQRAEQVAG